MTDNPQEAGHDLVENFEASLKKLLGTLSGELKHLLLKTHQQIQADAAQIAPEQPTEPPPAP